MRSILALRGRQVGWFARRGHDVPTPATAHHRQQHWRPVILGRRCIISTSSALFQSSSPDIDSFHGISLPTDKNKTSHPPNIQDAEVVKSEDDKQRTRELIKEVTRAEMLAHSTVSKNADKKDDVPEEGGKEAAAVALGPYERRLQQLNEAQHRHQTIDQQQTPLVYAQSCMDMGELHYQLGHMEDSQDVFMDALKELVSNSKHNDGGGESEIQMMIAQSMNMLGAIHARCGEYDEATRWYEESLSRKNSILRDSIDDEDCSQSYTSTFIRYELGKTYNGLAALEVMKGGNVQWGKAMSLFQEAESNYLHGYVEQDEGQGKGGVLEASYDSPTIVSKASIQQMTPRQVEAVINVRSNIGELLRQRGEFENAVEMLRSSLDMARLALEIEYEKSDNESEVVEDATATVVEGPSQDERRNTIVELQVTIADCLISAKLFDEAAEAYEQALSSHIFFRRWTENCKQKHHQSDQRTVLPATTTGTASTNIKLDLTVATTMEAAIRKNLAHALAQIGQENLSLGHYESSLAIFRHVGGDFHVEVANTLMGLGALLGGPMMDFSRALICFKEALFIYRTNLEEVSGVNGSDGNEDYENQNAPPPGSQGFFGDEEAEEMDRHIQDVLKNISLIEAALTKDKDGAKKRRP